ncbi:MAG: lytic transglycosylase domain-containing protein [Gammaproteobacteria bacterium]|nr:lytic transglycosylase domain-containing protein [Gammaproteobacteria bacterium]
MLEFTALASCIAPGVDPGIMRAIVAHESRGVITAINVNKLNRRVPAPVSIDEAAKAANLYIAKGYTVDIGLTQANSENLKRLKIPLQKAFDPCTNLKIGSYIYADALSRYHNRGYRGETLLRVALSAYNTGSPKQGFLNGYVDKVWKLYKRLTGPGPLRNEQEFLLQSAREAELDVLGIKKK